MLCRNKQTTNHNKQTIDANSFWMPTALDILVMTNDNLKLIFTSYSSRRLHEEVDTGSALPEQALQYQEELPSEWRSWEQWQLMTMIMMTIWLCLYPKRVMMMMTIGTCLYPKRVTSSGFPPKCFIFCCNHFKAAICSTIIILTIFITQILVTWPWFSHFLF